MAMEDLFLEYTDNHVSPTLRFALLILCIILFIVCSVGGAVYYIDANSGDDTNSGIANEPWKTLKKAGEVAEPGDTVYIREGRYAQSFYPIKSGTSNKPITFEGLGKVLFDNSIQLSDGFQKVPGTESCYQMTVSNYEIHNAWYQNDKFITPKTSFSEVEKNPFSLWHDNGRASENLTVGPDETLLKLKHDNLYPDVRLHIPSEKRIVDQNDYELDLKKGTIKFLRPPSKKEKIFALYRYHASNILYINLNGQIPDVSELKFPQYRFTIHASFLTFKNMELAYMEFGTDSEAEHITLEDMNIHHLGGGVYMRSNNAVLRRVESHHNNGGGVLFWGRDSLVDQSKFHHNGYCGVSFYANADNGILQNSLIFENIGGPTGEGAVRVSHDSDNVSIINNTICNNSGPGIRVFSEKDKLITNLSIMNNIIVGNDKNKNSPDDSGYFLIGENCQKGFQSDYNLLLPSDSGFVRWGGEEFPTLNSWQKTLGQDLHSIEAHKVDILNAVSLNGTPAQAIDKGTQENAPSYDIAGNRRPLSKAFDIGAFEK